MKHKDFESSNFGEIKAELLRLMNDPKCYAISTIGEFQNPLFKDFRTHRVRLIRRHGMLWLSEYDQYDLPWHGTPYRWMKLSCFSRCAGDSAEHIANKAAYYSKGEPTLIVGWFE